MNLIEKVCVLAEGAKYDVSCSSSGSNRKNNAGMGNASLPGICHTWSADGRCVSLLKILYSNKCIYDCSYCVNRSSSSCKRAEFEVDELVELTTNFYKRNYIEGLFLSSGVVKNPNYTMQQMIRVIKKLREEEKFYGYIHLKVIPGCDNELIDQAGKYVDRMSANMELPTKRSLKLLAPQKSQEAIARPMKYLSNKIKSTSEKTFLPAGQTTQLMVGATDDTDQTIVRLAEAMYNRLEMKRVYYSAYMPIVKGNPNLPSTLGNGKLREHRLYQVDWLMRFYDFKSHEILNENQPNLDLDIDPKAMWALNHMDFFPVEINKASFQLLLRIPGIGHISAKKILRARKFKILSYDHLIKMNISLKRAKYFITCNGKYKGDISFTPDRIRMRLIKGDPLNQQFEQLTLFDVLSKEHREAQQMKKLRRILN